MKKDIPIEIFETVLSDIARKYNLTKENIMSKSRRRPYPQARIALAKKLKAEKYSYCMIARAMGCDHTSIRYMCHDEIRQARKDKYRAQYVQE